MRNEIENILHKHDADPHGVDISGYRKINAHKVADELTALMCYREVRAFCDAYNVFHGEYSDENLRDEIILSIGAEYDQNTILQAFGKYKNEQK